MPNHFHRHSFRSFVLPFPFRRFCFFGGRGGFIGKCRPHFSRCGLCLHAPILFSFFLWIRVLYVCVCANDVKSVLPLSLPFVPISNSNEFPSCSFITAIDLFRDEEQATHSVIYGNMGA